MAEEEEIMIIIDHPIEEVGVEDDTEDHVHGQTHIIKVVEGEDIVHAGVGVETGCIMTPKSSSCARFP